MRKQQFVGSLIALEICALVLAYVQYGRGLVTDEAKYLLSIPYPHPPFVRTILAWTATLPAHEFFWRFVFASALLQAVWFVWDLGEVLPRPRRIALALSWLFASATIVQSGMIVMAVVSALSGLIFLWWALHPRPSKKPALIALLWLASLFTAYQSVLFAPLVFSSLRRTQISFLRVLQYLCIPVILLGLYSLSNPYALSIIVHVSGEEMAIPMLTRISSIVWVWILGGSVILSLVGSMGILLSRRSDLLMTFGLAVLFVVLTSRDYDAILFTPLFVGGLFILFCRRRIPPTVFIALEFFFLIVLVTMMWRPLGITESRAEMRALPMSGLTGTMIIDGFFGHEWQYDSPLPLRRFSQALSADAEDEASVFVCTASNGCDEDVADDVWEPLHGMPFPTWVKRSR